jgi:hypothetical protein
MALARVRTFSVETSTQPRCPQPGGAVVAVAVRVRVMVVAEPGPVM